MDNIKKKKKDHWRINNLSVNKGAWLSVPKRCKFNYILSFKIQINASMSFEYEIYFIYPTLTSASAERSTDL
jgi:hypothetical protein